MPNITVDLIEEDLLDYYELYVQECIANPVEKPVFIKSGPLSGKQLIERVPKPRSVGGFCIFLDVTTSTWNEWKKKGMFTEAITKIEDRIFEWQVNGAQVDMYNANIVSKRLGLVQKTEISTPEEGGFKVLTA